MYKYKEYPTWEEIYKDIAKEDLIEIIHLSLMDENMTIEEVIYDYIESNYDGVEVVDGDALRDLKRDEEIL
jgi:hypothetical protein